MASDLVIGIDLGTTYSCVAVFRNGKVEIIPNEEGKFTTPSCVAYTESEIILVGKQAKNLATFEPEITIYGIKRIMGRKFDDPEIQEDIKNWPFKVINDKNVPKIEISHNGKKNKYNPEEVSARVLSKMRNIAEKYLKTTIQKCVITVPAYFTDSQRQATIDAGKMAGLQVLKTINEPTAAALAYSLIKKSNEEKNVLIYDLGGGTFDVSVLRIKNTDIRVLSTKGNMHLGGEDFDTRLVDFTLKEFKNANREIKEINKKVVRRVRSWAEIAKIRLSTETTVCFIVDALVDRIDLEINITRRKFEELNNDLFRSTLKIVTECLLDAKLTKNQIDEVVLIGGSTKIPKVRSILKKYFKGKVLNCSINADEAVAYGAAIKGAMVNKDLSKVIQEIVLYDITPHALGINVIGGIFSVIINRNTSVPTKKTGNYTTSIDYQTEVEIIVYEGQSTICKNNNLLGKFTISGFPALPKGKIQFLVSFDIDDNGILNVDCEETLGVSKQGIKIDYHKGRLTDEEINNYKNEMANIENEKEFTKKIRDLKLEIYSYCSGMISNVNLKNTRIAKDVKEMIIQKCDDLMGYIDTNQFSSVEEYMKKLNDIKTYCDQKLKQK